jgi:probable DNA repair protein
MPENFTDIHLLDSELQDGWIILTPNHRTAVQVHESYGAFLKQHSQPSVRPSPEIFPVDIWIKNIFHELLVHEKDLQANTLLESYQELILWKKIIAESEISNPLLRLENSASKVLEAYRLLVQWQISVENLEGYQNKISDSSHLDDCTAFLHWLKKYQDYCHKEGLTSFSELLKSLIPYLEKHADLLPEKIILLGFTEPPPLYQAFFSILQATKKVKHLQWKLTSPDITKKSCADHVSEINAAVKWSKDILESNSDAKIAIITNELSAQYALLQNHLGTVYPAQANQNSVFYIDSAIKLTKDYPEFQELTELLRLNLPELSGEDVCHILRSPLLLAQEEEHARAALEHYLRRKQQSVVRSAQLRNLLNNEKSQWHSPGLGQALEQCENLRRKQSRQQSLHDWAELFEEQLAILIWSDNAVFQKRQFLLSCWQQVLENFKKLAFLHNKMTFKQAFNLLQQLISSFSHSENRQEAPIQILTPVDARGLRFSHVWFMGLSDLQWPAFQYPNPFIPVSLQRSEKFPDSSPELSHENAKQILLEIQSNTSEQLVLSYPRTNTDGELLPSPLLNSLTTESAFPEKNESSLQLHPFSLQSFQANKQSKPIEYLEETSHLETSESEILKGGSSLIANQAECPFRAFAIHRLKAEELKEFTYGIPATDIGSAIHLVLEKLWGQLKTQRALSTLNNEELQIIISSACASGIEFLRNKHPYLFHPAYAELEEKRFIKLTQNWLEQEKLRSCFEVMEKEFKVQWQHAELSLDLKIDRIDQLDKGYAVIDYKSGSSKPAITDDLRPSDPQLLLYADALDQQELFKPVNALLYAQVNISSLSYQGISLDDETLSGTGLNHLKNFADYATWDDLKQHWKQVLSTLAQEFLDGFLAVEPKSNSSCQYCHLQALCRIQEKRIDDGVVSHD